jgi:tetratricopeptide (TPR) repeat protein
MRNDYDADAYLGRGRAYNSLHQYQEALEDFDKVRARPG